MISDIKHLSCYKYYTMKRIYTCSKMSSFKKRQPNKINVWGTKKQPPVLLVDQVHEKEPCVLPSTKPIKSKPKKDNEEKRRKEFSKAYKVICDAYFVTHNLSEVVAKMRFDKYGDPDDYYTRHLKKEEDSIVEK